MVPLAAGSFQVEFEGSTLGNHGAPGVRRIIHDGAGATSLSLLGIASGCSINEMRLLSLRTGLYKANRLNMCNIMVQGDFICIIRRALDI